MAIFGRYSWKITYEIETSTQTLAMVENYYSLMHEQETIEHKTAVYCVIFYVKNVLMIISYCLLEDLSFSDGNLRSKDLHSLDKFASTIGKHINGLLNAIF